MKCLNQIGVSVTKLKSKRIGSLSKLFFRNKVFLLRETVSVLNIYCSMCRGCWQVGLNKEQEIWNFLRRSVKTPSSFISHLVFEIHLLVLMLHLNLLCWPLNLRFINVCCFSHYLFAVVWMVFKCVVFFNWRSWIIFKKWVLKFPLLFYGWRQEEIIWFKTIKLNVENETFKTEVNLAGGLATKCFTTCKRSFVSIKKCFRQCFRKRAGHTWTVCWPGAW